jgi:hypothetical protein
MVSPLKIIWPWVLVLLIRAERTHVAGRVMDKAMPDHLVLPLEALATYASWTGLDGAEVWSAGGVDVRVRIEEILGLEG